MSVVVNFPSPPPSWWTSADYRLLFVGSMDIYYGWKQLETFFICGAENEKKKLRSLVVESLSEAIERLDQGLNPNVIVVWCENEHCVLEWASFAMTLDSLEAQPAIRLVGPAAEAQSDMLSEHLKSYRGGVSQHEQVTPSAPPVDEWLRSAKTMVVAV